MTAFTVYYKGRMIDKVFYTDKSGMTVKDIKRDLVGHDGYHPDIVVRKARK